jgi:hypothetical protein
VRRRGDGAWGETSQNCAWLYRRMQLLRMLLEQLRAEAAEAAEAAGAAGVASDGDTAVMVTAEHIASLQAAEAQRTAALGGAWGTSGGQTMFITNSVEMDLSDLEGATVQAVQQRLGEVVRMHALAAQAEQSMHDDMKGAWRHPPRRCSRCFGLGRCDEFVGQQLLHDSSTSFPLPSTPHTHDRCR